MLLFADLNDGGVERREREEMFEVTGNYLVFRYVVMLLLRCNAKTSCPKLSAGGTNKPAQFLPQISRNGMFLLPPFLKPGCRVVNRR